MIEDEGENFTNMPMKIPQWKEDLKAIRTHLVIRHYSRNHSGYIVSRICRRGPKRKDEVNRSLIFLWFKRRLKESTHQRTIPLHGISHTASNDSGIKLRLA
ncbi:MAG TPA: hypothetical protein DD706_05580 [Nitrospiraceae bacterium]|nr:hypothetical protein [Nitrospiraceae bacterium]